MFDKPDQYAVVLSDIHIGDKAPTCWYQDRVHFPYLASTLDWIVARRASVREVIFLGDTFDVWTYEPARQPPPMSEIIAAHPRLLGATGPLAALVRALPGRVRLLPGNHDGSLTRSDIAQLNVSLTGNPNTGIQLVTEPSIVLTGASGARTLFEHGHRWCMFNASDPRSRWNEIPVGHFVSRGIAYRVATKHRGKTAAELPVSGNGDMDLTGDDFAAIWSQFRKRRDLNLVEELLRHVTRKTGLARDAAIMMPGGGRSSLGQASAVFAGLFADWSRREGDWNAARAAAADATGEDLAWFALRQAMCAHADLVVMGHTHSAVKGLTVAPLGVEYVNSGFECVSLPDAAKGVESTFALVDLEAPSASLIAVQQVGGRMRFVPSRAGKAPVVIRRRKQLPWPFNKLTFQDFSCYVRVENRTKTGLRLVRSSVRRNDSIWVVAPPAEIPAGGRADIWLQDKLGMQGSDGRFTYTDGRSNLNFVFSCPTVPPNRVSARVTERSPGAPPSGLVINYEARAGNDPWRQRDVQAFGHPVQMRCVVGVPAVKPPPGPASVAANGNGGPRLPLGDRVVEGVEYLSHGRYLTVVGGRHVANPRAIDAARGRRIRWQRSGLVANIDSVRVEDQGPMRGGRRVRVVITLRVLSPGTSGLRVGATFDLAWRAFSHGGIVESLAPA
ncbi:MAG: metallophosphoesterase [Solirubrobacteraceae bacterium]